MVQSTRFPPSDRCPLRCIIDDRASSGALTHLPRFTQPSREGPTLATVYPRRRSLPRPSYLPTAIAERLNQPVLPSDRLSPFERAQLAKHGYDPEWLDTLTPDIVRVHMRLPLKPVPETPLKVYKPPEPAPYDPNSGKT